MEAAVIYFSKTGHSKKIARAVARELNIRCEDINQNPDLSGTDLLFVVGGIYGGRSDPKMLDFIEGVDNNKVKKAALITSCCSNKSPQAEVRKVLGMNKVEVIPDECICRGSFLFVRVGHPNQSDIDKAVAFAKKTLAAVS